MDSVYRCYRCGKFVYEAQIIYGSHCCEKCGSRKLEPLMQNLTKFGVWYCETYNNYYNWYYKTVRPVQ